MKKRIYLLLFGLALLCGQSLMAQKISGVVTGEEDGTAIPGVSVVVKGTPKGTITTIDGNYEIEAKEGETIVFSLVGYQRQEVVVSKGVKTFNIVMGGGTSKLDEVVVTAMGVDKAKRTLGFSAQQVSGQDLAEVNRENFVDALQSRIAGLTVNSTGGAPGSSSQIILRAATSFSQDNQPLFVVDGVPINNRTFNQGALVSDRPNRDLDYSSPIADINPNDIETVNVLKGWFLWRKWGNCDNNQTRKSGSR
jgi:CarboxypepD_reg-like domain/TonB-dependent Receptor Plug Domain